MSCLSISAWCNYVRYSLHWYNVHNAHSYFIGRTVCRCSPSTCHSLSWCESLDDDAISHTKINPLTELNAKKRRFLTRAEQDVWCVDMLRWLYKLCNLSTWHAAMPHAHHHNYRAPWCNGKPFNFMFPKLSFHLHYISSVHLQLNIVGNTKEVLNRFFFLSSKIGNFQENCNDKTPPPLFHDPSKFDAHYYYYYYFQRFLHKFIWNFSAYIHIRNESAIDWCRWITDVNGFNVLLHSARINQWVGGPISRCNNYRHGEWNGWISLHV